MSAPVKATVRVSPRAPLPTAWTDNDVQWLLEAAVISREWMAHAPPASPVGAPGAELGHELLALCWEAARRDLFAAPSGQRRATLLRVSQDLCRAKITLDTQPGGPGAPRGPIQKNAPARAKRILPKLVAKYGADSIVVARAEASIRVASEQLQAVAP
jgi:hypothetical protein